jgi:4-aminobutyrate aminotransferase-like enzyme
LPESLRVCYFVNSGSEANELAIRLARAHTQARLRVRRPCSCNPCLRNRSTRKRSCSPDRRARCNRSHRHE